MSSRPDRLSTVKRKDDGTLQPVKAQAGRRLEAVIERARIELHLVDQQGFPLADEPFEIRRADGVTGVTIEGKLDLHGRATVLTFDPRDTVVTFPRLDAKSWKAGQGKRPRSEAAPPASPSSTKGGTGTRVRFEDMMVRLIGYEGKVASMYLDTNGYVTVGIGCLLRTPAEASELPFLNVDTKESASAEEIRAAFSQVAAMRERQASERHRMRPSVELTEETIVALAKSRFDGFVADLEKKYAGFASYPPPAQQVLIDMAYNLGTGRLFTEFKKLREAVERRDWRAAAGHCHIRSSTPHEKPNSQHARRNAWRRACFEKLADEAAGQA